MEEQNHPEEEWLAKVASPPRTLEAHYRSLVLAIIAITALVVVWVGWSVRRDRPSPTDVVMASPRQATVPLTGGASETAARLTTEAPSVVTRNLALPTSRSPVATKAAPAADLSLPRVHVVGAVQRSGVYALPPRSRVVDALQKAGGARPDADLEAINLADFVQDGEQIRVPSRRETARIAARSAVAGPPASPIVASRRASKLLPTPARALSPTRTRGRYPTAAAVPGLAAPAGGVVNVNTAGAEELDTLPGVGPATARAILDYRAEHGPFQRPEDLLQVRGIGEKKLAKMLDRVTVR